MARWTLVGEVRRGLGERFTSGIRTPLPESFYMVARQGIMNRLTRQKEEDNSPERIRTWFRIIGREVSDHDRRLTFRSCCTEVNRSKEDQKQLSTRLARYPEGPAIFGGPGSITRYSFTESSQRLGPGGLEHDTVSAARETPTLRPEASGL